MKNKSKAKEFLPLTEATYYILVSLIEPLHGYGIMQNVKELSKEEFLLGPGTLYGALNKLEKAGLIQKIENDEDNRRKNYVITDLGKKVIRLELARLKNLVISTENYILRLGGDINGERN
ncbi:PadR family transcriptional regulator [Clostridium sp. DL1XJH146]